MKTFRNRKGFTLVEVMIVVAIIGLLAAIAIPNLLRARINANDGAVKGDLRAFSTAIESYRAAQQPPAYPDDVAPLTSTDTGPAYLDASWNGDDDGVINKHGHTLVYELEANGYSLIATSSTGQSEKNYCIDQTGVLKVDTDAITSGDDGCVGGDAITS